MGVRQPGMRHGWIEIHGVQTGDRTLEEQTIALRPAIAECAGKAVLDLGCSEGLIGREFVLAGARCCFGIDSLADHIKVAREQCKGLPMEFLLAGLMDFDTKPLPNPFKVEKYEIVLALGVAHKLEQPRVAVELAARMSSDLVLFRRGHRQNDDGIIRAKHFSNTVDQPKVMQSLGFTMEKLVEGIGPHFEAVEYWRRK